MKYENIKTILKKQLNISEIHTEKNILSFELDIEEFQLKKIISEINEQLSEIQIRYEKTTDKKNYLKVIEISDHRKFKNTLEIYDFDPMIGSGLPYWLENGTILKEIISSYINHIQRQEGIIMVSTPELGKKELYETSGHWDHYQENMFPVMQIDNDEYVLRPMTCPHHILMYKRIRRHENHLPIAFGENSKLYRYECSGGLYGLERTRRMELIDTHIFCTYSQLFDSLKKSFNIIKKVEKAFQIKYDSVIFSKREKNNEKFYNDEELWNKSESILKNFLDVENIEYKEGIGDAAFYGPKIDFQIKTLYGKIITISTIQIDFLLPKKFNISYLAKEGGKEIPIMIHLGIIGTLERFISYLLERDNGWLPFWLSPVQVAIIPINNSKHLEYAKKIYDKYKKMNLRAIIEDGKDNLSKKISKLVEKRIYGYVIIGDKEMQEFESIDELNWEAEIKRIVRTKSSEKPENMQYPEDHMDLFRWKINTNE